jgi:hypothetical protein
MPDEVTREQDFAAFKAELIDEFNLKTAEISIKEGKVAPPNICDKSCQIFMTLGQ